MVYFPVIEAYEAQVYLNMTLTSCRVWAEDGYHARIGGDGRDHYHNCDGTAGYREMIIGTERDGPNDWYWIIVKTEAGIDDYLHKPFNSHSCVCVAGTVRDIKISGYPIDAISRCNVDAAC
ncbi:hypothetical protein C2G38_2142141 [Gigaspora rosea]|uniref:Uncharacterized protein n=1 Tax=Gigaspora rosea TaxID=44941 RepID=A0A397VGH1_9GLOM|nr:hypothetical protein C2G38_2142141 [Gigaspora rosea]